MTCLLCIFPVFNRPKDIDILSHGVIFPTPMRVYVPSEVLQRRFPLTGVPENDPMRIYFGKFGISLSCHYICYLSF